MDSDQLKEAAARAALDYVPSGAVIGVGTGSTTAHFIEALASIKDRVAGAVPSSKETAAKLEAVGVTVADLEGSGILSVYVDGADEVDGRLRLIKGGGGALTREKILASASEAFVCIADECKLVDELGEFPLALEVIPMARAYVMRVLGEMDAMAELREGFTTDNGNIVLDTHGLDFSDPERLEHELDGIAGVVANGLFARRRADTLLLATSGETRVVCPD